MIFRCDTIFAKYEHLLPYNAFNTHNSVAELIDEVHVSGTLAHKRLPTCQAYSGADRDHA